jgi:hypothetical protein
LPVLSEIDRGSKKNMSAFKIVGRVLNERTSYGGWLGKVGTQWKKRVYVNRKDFEKYAPETASRWSKHCEVDVEAYEMIKDKWQRCQIPKKDIINENS